MSEPATTLTDDELAALKKRVTYLIDSSPKDVWIDADIWLRTFATIDDLRTRLADAEKRAEEAEDRVECPACDGESYINGNNCYLCRCSFVYADGQRCWNLKSQHEGDQSEWTSQPHSFALADRTAEVERLKAVLDKTVFAPSVPCGQAKEYVTHQFKCSDCSVRFRSEDVVTVIAAAPDESES